MRIKLAIITLLLVNFLQTSTIAQNALSYKISEVENIPQTQIQFVYDGKDKITWIGSGRELLRYDGDQAVNLKVLSPGLTIKNSVGQLMEFKNKFYLLVKGDSCLIDLASDGTASISNICISENSIVQLSKNKNELFFLTSQGNTHRIFRTTGKKINLFQEISSSSATPDARILVDDSFVYFLSDQVLSVFDFFGNQLDREEIKTRPQYTFGKNTMSIGKFQDKTIFSHPYFTGIQEVSISNKDISIRQLINIDKFSVSILKFDEYDNAVAAWSDENGFMYQISRFGTNDVCDPEHFFLEDKTMQCISGRNFMEQITIGGYFGLRHLSFPKQIFKSLLSKTLQNSKYLENGFSMRGIVKVGSDIYFAREIKTVYRYNPASNHLDTMSLKDQDGNIINLKCTNDLLYSKKQNRLFLSSCGESIQNYLISIDPKTGNSIRYNTPDRIQSMTFGVTEDVIVCGFSSDSIGVGVFDIPSEKFVHFIKKNQATNFFCRMYDGTLFLGTKNGLQILDKNNSPSARYQDLVSIIGNDEIYHISKKNELIFIGTAHNGLFVFNQNDHKILQVNDRAGIKSNAIASVLVDDANFVWLATFNGLYLMDSTFKTIKEFDVSDGINHNEFNRYSYFKDGNNLYLGSINGILKVDASDLSTSNYLKGNPIYLQKMVYYDRKSKGSRVTYFSDLPNQIKLHSDETNHRLSFGSRTMGEHIILRARLSPEDSDWRYQDVEGYISLSDLGSGRYTLSLQFKNIAGEWEDYDQTIFFDRIQYFNETSLFRWLLYGSLALAIGIYVLNLYKQKQEYEKLRESIAHDLHDQLGSALTSISMKAQMLDESSNEADFKGIANDTKEALQLVRDTIWSVNPGNDLVEHLIDRCKDFAYNLLQNRSVEVKFLSKLDNYQKLNIKTRKELFLIFKEALTNVIKHSNPSFVEVTFQQDAGNFELIITNDGTEESSSVRDQGLSIGLKSMSLRAKNIGGQINFDSHQNIFKVHLVTPLIYL